MSRLDALPLRRRVRDAILELIFDNDLEPGAQLGIAQLTRQLGVSATPIREALVELTQEGFLEAASNRGFFVAGFSLVEVRELYVVIASLEATAVQLQAPLPKHRLDRLVELNDAFRGETSDPRRSSELDDEWHTELTIGCNNRVLLDTLRSLKLRAARYEYAYMRHDLNIPRSHGDHRRIAERLKAHDHAGVRPLLDSHWKRSIDFLAQALAANEEREP